MCPPLSTNISCHLLMPKVPPFLSPHPNRQQMSPNLTLSTTSAPVQATHCHLSPGLCGTSLLTGLPAPTLAPHHPFSTQSVPVQTWVKCHRFSTPNPPVASHLPLSKTKVLPLPPPLNPSTLSSSYSRLLASPQVHGLLLPQGFGTLCALCQATAHHTS